MSKRLALYCAFSVLTASLALRAGPPRPGMPSEDQGLELRARDLDDQPFEGKTLRGKVVLLDFWADWCAPCIKAFPVLTELQEKYGQAGLEVLGIAAYSGEPAQVRTFLENRPVGYRMLVADVDLVERFEVIGFPTYFLIDREGRIAKKYVGSLADLMEEIRRDIEDLLNDKPIHQANGGRK